MAKADTPKTGERSGALPGEAGSDTIRAIQRELDQRGYGPIAADGVMRPVTRAAILSWEYDNKLPLTGEATEALLTRLVLGAPGNEVGTSAREVQSAHAEATIKRVQRLLSANGYRPGPADGRLRSDTVEAIRAFEQDQGLAPKGRVSAEVLARLQASTGRLKSAEAR
jgi:peptidoglycan hydrolase-like protein with peptidoglycan-binding domain